MNVVEDARSLKRAVPEERGERLLSEIVRLYRILFGVSGACSIWLLSDDDEKVKMVACDGYDYSLAEIEEKLRERPCYRVPPKQGTEKARRKMGVTAWIVAQNKPFLTSCREDFGTNRDHLGRYDRYLWKDPSRGCQSFYGIPLPGRGRPAVGVVKVEHPDTLFFTEERQAQIELVAALVSAIIDRDFTVQTVREIISEAAGRESFDDILQSLVTGCRKALSAAACSVFLPDWRADGRLALRADDGHVNSFVVRGDNFDWYGPEYTYEPHEGITGRVFQTGQAEWANSPREVNTSEGHAGKLWARQWGDDRECQSIYVAPIKALSGRTLGVLKVEDKLGRNGKPAGNHFTTWDAEVLEHVAFQLGILLERRAKELEARFGAIGGLRESVGDTLLSALKNLGSEGGVGRGGR